MGIVKNNTSTGQLACGRGLEETVFYPGSRRKLVEKSRERHVLNCEFGIWMGGECWANHALEGIWGWGRLALTSHPRSGRDLGMGETGAHFPPRVFAGLPFSPCRAFGGASAASLLNALLGVSRTVPAVRLGLPVQWEESFDARMVLGPYSTFVR